MSLCCSLPSQETTAGLALAAGAAATQVGRVDAGRLDRLQHALVLADRHRSCRIARARSRTACRAAARGTAPNAGSAPASRLRAPSAARRRSCRPGRRHRDACRAAGCRAGAPSGMSVSFRVAIDLDAMRAVALQQLLPIGAVVARAHGVMQFEMAPSRENCSIIAMNGVMPMPPAIRICLRPRWSGGKQIDRLADLQLVAFAAPAHA